MGGQLLQPGAGRRRAGRHGHGQPAADGHLRAAGSDDPDPGDLLIYEWDLDGDGELDDSTAEAPTHTYLTGGVYTVTLRVTDTSGATSTDTVTIKVGSGPLATIDTPTAGTTWATGESSASRAPAPTRRTARCPDRARLERGAGQLPHARQLPGDAHSSP